MANVSSYSLRPRRLGKGHAMIHVLVVLFGISAWIGINGSFMQLPIFINTSPEGWNLPTYIVLVIQSANVGPILYVIIRQFRWKVNESLCIMCLLAFATLAMCFLMFFHSTRIIINGVEHSLFLFVLIFFVALVGCFSSIIFMPYLRDFDQIYMVSYFIGEGLSGVLPSVVALIQGTEELSECIKNSNSTLPVSNLKFTPKYYFFFLFVTLLLSFIAFIVLHYSPFVRQNRGLNKFSYSSNNELIKNKFHNNSTMTYDNSPCENINHQTQQNKVVKTKDTSEINEHKHLPIYVKYYLTVLIGIYCFFNNGFLPSIQSYSCLPYGNLAYQLSIIFSQIANPLACLCTLWFTMSSIRGIGYLSIICIISGTYVIYLAIMSPTPPMQESKFGMTLLIMSWTIVIGFISYLKLTIVSVFQNSESPRILFYVGTIMQIGSACGAISSFLLVNVAHILKVYDVCS